MTVVEIPKGSTTGKIYVYDGAPIRHLKRGEEVQVDVVLSSVTMTSTLTGRRFSSSKDVVACSYKGRNIGFFGRWRSPELRRIAEVNGGNVRLWCICRGEYAPGIPALVAELPGDAWMGAAMRGYIAANEDYCESIAIPKEYWVGYRSLFGCSKEKDISLKVTSRDGQVFVNDSDLTIATVPLSASCGPFLAMLEGSVAGAAWVEKEKMDDGHLRLRLCYALSRPSYTVTKARSSGGPSERFRFSGASPSLSPVGPKGFFSSLLRNDPMPRRGKILAKLKDGGVTRSIVQQNGPLSPFLGSDSAFENEVGFELHTQERFRGETWWNALPLVSGKSLETMKAGLTVLEGLFREARKICPDVPSKIQLNPEVFGDPAKDGFTCKSYGDVRTSDGKLFAWIAYLQQTERGREPRFPVVINVGISSRFDANKSYSCYLYFSADGELLKADACYSTKKAIVRLQAKELVSGDGIQIEKLRVCPAYGETALVYEHKKPKAEKKSDCTISTHKWTEDEKHFICAHPEMTNRELAEKYGVSIKSIEHVKNRIRRKQGG